MHGGGSGGGRADVCGWQLHHGKRESPQPNPSRTVAGGSASELWGAEVPGRTEQENGDGEAIHQQDKVSTTDPDSTYLTKGNRAAELGYFDNYLIDNESCVIVGVQATAARLSQESAAARDMIDRYCERYGRRPKGVAADTTYGNGEMLQWLDERGIAGYIRVKENPKGQATDLYGIDQFTYVPEENCYICPEGKVLKYTGINKHNNTHVRLPQQKHESQETPACGGTRPQTSFSTPTCDFTQNPFSAGWGGTECA